MMNPDAPRSMQQHISVQQVGAETLLYDERRHQAFCLNETCSVIWRLADGERTIAEISAAASIQVKVPVNDDFVRFAIEELRRDGLMESSEVAEAGHSLSRRTMLQRLGVGSALLLPTIAAIVAPTAAQAYSGCVDCSSQSSSIRLARARTQKPGNATTSGPLSGGLESPSASGK
jgi:hypothetical protein